MASVSVDTSPECLVATKLHSETRDLAVRRVLLSADGIAVAAERHAEEVAAERNHDGGGMAWAGSFCQGLM